MALVNAGHKVGGDWVPSYPRICLKPNVTPNDKMFEFKCEESDLKSLGFASSQKFSGKTSIRMLCIRITNKDIVLSSENIRPTRMTEEEPEKFICLSFANLTFCELKNSQKLTSCYIQRVLINGIRLNETLYEFCGHSNSQLQSRCCYLRVCYFTSIIFGYFGQQLHTMDVLINKNGNFRDIKDVSKCSKRIALLFTSSVSNFTVNSKDTKMIKDIVKQEKNFTDGCGFIDSIYAEKIVKALNITSNSKNKTDISVLQIRYKGYKGILTVIPEDQMQQLVFQDKNLIISIFLMIMKSWFNTVVEDPKSTPKILFRKSMEKFQRCDKETLCIVDHSKPFSYGYLNGELITLLATLKIPDSVFQNKLKWYLDLVANCTSHLNSAIEFSIFKNKIHLMKQLKELRQSKSYSIPADLRSQLGKLQKDEKDYFYKDDKLKARILIPKSRLLFGVCDPTGKLKYGECFVQYTDTRIRKKNYNIYNHQTTEKLAGKIIVTRNPCLHPGDIQLFNAVDIPELDYLVDCIVFSVKGDTPAASTMSGGDLDGDKFFVCWDPELIPLNFYEPEDYSKYTPNSKQKANISQGDLIHHFSNYNTFQLGQIKSLHSKWVEGKLSRAASSQCIELNRLHSKSVDGGRVFIPKHLKKYPSPTNQEFILKTLEREIINVFPCATLSRDQDLDDIDDSDSTPDEMEMSNENAFILHPLVSRIFWLLLKNLMAVLKGIVQSIFRLF